jgi:hypothetical protein
MASAAAACIAAASALRNSSKLERKACPAGDGFRGATAQVAHRPARTKNPRRGLQACQPQSIMSQKAGAEPGLERTQATEVEAP